MLNSIHSTIAIDKIFKYICKNFSNPYFDKAFKDKEYFGQYFKKSLKEFYMRWNFKEITSKAFMLHIHIYEEQLNIEANDFDSFSRIRYIPCCNRPPLLPVDNSESWKRIRTVDFSTKYE